MFRIYTPDDFDKCIGGSFFLNYPDYSETLTLEGISISKRTIPGFRQGFILFFHGTNPHVQLGQYTYHLHNDVLGEISILLTPFRRKPDGNFIYQAVFA